MRALVVFETEFGNTGRIARSIADGLGKILETEIVSVAQAPTAIDADVALVVIGGPTHTFSMSRPSTRRDAVRRGGSDPGIGIREWLGGLSAPAGQRFACFDSRIGRVRGLPGSAARGAARVVRRRRLGRVLAVDSFYVGEVAGPVLEGELDRAFHWGRRLGAGLRVPVVA